MKRHWPNYKKITFSALFYASPMLTDHYIYDLQYCNFKNCGNSVKEPGLDHPTEEPSDTRRSWRVGGLFHTCGLRGE